MPALSKPLHFGPRALEAFDSLSPSMRAELHTRLRSALNHWVAATHLHVLGFCVEVDRDELGERVVRALSVHCQQPEAHGIRT